MIFKDTWQFEMKPVIDKTDETFEQFLEQSNKEYQEKLEGE